MWRSVLRNVEYGLELRGVPRAERRRIAEEHLRLVGLERFADFFPKDLSGGMRKRVQIAAVFANSPEVLLMDEPFGSLDYVTKVTLQQELLRIWTQERKKTLFVTPRHRGGDLSGGPHLRPARRSDREGDPGPFRPPTHGGNAHRPPVQGDSRGALGRAGGGSGGRAERRVMSAGASETPARPSRWRRPPWRQLLPNHWQILGLVCLIAAYEAFAWWVLSDNPRRADRMFPRIEYVATVSFPEFATYYGFDEGLLGYRQNVGQALMVLFENALVTIRRLVIGLVAGIGLGIGVGLLVGMSRWARDVVLPPVLLLRTIPILALIPLFMFWFGAREVGILIFVSFAVFSMMIVNTLEAIRNVPPIYQDYARCMGATRRQIYRTVIVPAILPSLNGGIRVILGLSFAIVLAGELLATDSGLGWLMILSERFFMIGRIVVIVVIFVILSLILNGLYLAASRYVNRWVP